MAKIKEGDKVGRKSYGKDIIFIVDKIINSDPNNQTAILKGLTIRIQADANIEDLELIEQEKIDSNLRGLEERLTAKIKKHSNSKMGLITKRNKRIEETGKILHLDVDAHLSNQKKYSNTNTSEQVIFNHNKNNVSKIKIHYFFITKREEFCEREHI